MKIIILLLVFLMAVAGGFGALLVVQQRYGTYEQRVAALSAGQLKEMFVFMSPQTIIYLKLAAVVVMALIGLAWTGSFTYGLLFAGAGTASPSLRSGGRRRNAWRSSRNSSPRRCRTSRTG